MLEPGKAKQGGQASFQETHLRLRYLVHSSWEIEDKADTAQPHAGTGGKKRCDLRREALPLMYVSCFITGLSSHAFGGGGRCRRLGA